jgi:putative toxin-antitoxin system antitoxin component (TIGR02293 family)
MDEYCNDFGGTKALESCCVKCHIICDIWRNPKMTVLEPSDEDLGIDRTFRLLGGKKTLRRQVHSRLEAHDLIEKGLPAKALNHLVTYVAILSAPHHGSLEKAVGMSLRTYQRRKDAPNKPLSPEQSGRTWKFAEILGRVIDVFGSQKEAEEWLERPAMALDQRKPIDLLSTPAGVESVEDHLTRLEYGVYT